jgi:hypothetical protein
LITFAESLARHRAGRKRVLNVEDWAEIRRLGGAERMSISQIARVLGVSRNTVRSALASDTAPKYERAPAGSAVDAVEPRIRELLQVFPMMPATVCGSRRSGCRSGSGRPEGVQTKLADDDLNNPFAPPYSGAGNPF